MAFPIKCTDCNKSFSISDEVYERKVRGKLVTIKCKSCGTAIRVDGTQLGSDSKPAPAGKAKSGSPPAVAKSEAPDLSIRPVAASGENLVATVKASPVAAPTAELKPEPKPQPKPEPKAERKPEPKPEPKATPKAEPIALDAGTAKAKTEPKAPGQLPGKALISSPTKPAATRGGFNETTPAAPAAKAAAALEVRSKNAGGMTPKPATAKVSREGTDEILWAVDYGESEHRELTTAEVAEELKKGNIDGQTLVWHDNMPDWLTILDVKELRGFVDDKPKAPPPPPPKSAPQVTARSKGLPSVPKAAPPPPLGPLSSRPPAAPSPPKLASSRPPPPPPPKKSRPPAKADDDVITSARVFDDSKSADPFPPLSNRSRAVGGEPSPSPPAAAPNPFAPGAGAFPAAPAQLAPAAPAFSPAPGLPAPPSAAAAPALAPTPAFAPQPPMPAAPALGAPALAAPIAPAPRLAPAPALADDIEWPQARSKKPLVLGVLGVAAIGIVAWLLLGSGEEQSKPASPQTQAATPQPMSPPEPAPAPSPTPEAAPPEPTPDTGPADAPKEPASADRKSGDFADMFEQSAKGSR